MPLILIVDDDEHVRDLLEMALRNEGFEIVAARDGHEASQKAAERAPDLVIADLMMPGQGGWEFLRAFSAAGHGQVPVIVLSGSLLDAKTVDMVRKEARVIDFLHKPITVGKLAAILHAQLGTKPPQKR